MFDESDGTTRPLQSAAEPFDPTRLERILQKVYAPTIETPAPCAEAWCERGGNHPYSTDPLFPDQLIRFHERVLLERPFMVAVSALEEISADGVRMTQPTVVVADAEGGELTADEARKVAAALVEAAGLMDRLGGSR